LLSVSILFQLNETTNICTGNRDHSDHYRRLRFTSQHTHIHTHTHTHAYSYMFSVILTGIIEKFSVSAIRSYSKQFPIESLPTAQCVISDNSSEYSYHYLTSYSYKYSHTYFLYNLMENELFSSQCLRQTESMPRFGSLLVYQTNDRFSKPTDFRVVC
jgi:hypothetical protein